MSIVYSIKDLEKLSGVKAHTLRIWEKRYGVIKPHRDTNNIRYFLDDDLKKVLNIVYLNKNGIKISKIASMCEAEIENRVQEISNTEIDPVEHVDALILAILQLDEPQCNQLLEKSISKVGMELTMYQLIYPLLDKLSLLWISGSLKGVHEAMIRNVIRTKVSSEINKLEIDKSASSKKFMIFLPENERHELSLLFLHYILKKNNAQVINLGMNTTVHDIIQGCEIIKPDYAFTFINDSFLVESLQSYIDFLSSHVEETKLLFSGFQFVRQDIKMRPNCKYVSCLKEVEQFVK